MIVHGRKLRVNRLFKGWKHIQRVRDGRLRDGNTRDGGVRGVRFKDGRIPT